MPFFNRLLLASASAAAIASSAYAGETPTVTVGGFINFQAGYSDQGNAFEAGTRHQSATIPKCM